jgi:ABC-type amino acid transport substrate-binding protein
MGLLIPATQSDLTLPQLEGRRIAMLEHSAYQRLLAAEEQPFTVQANPILKEFPPNVRPAPVSNLIKAIHQLSGDTDTPPPFDAIFGPAPVFAQAVEAGLPVALVSGWERLGKQPLAVAAVRQEGLQVDRLLAEINRVLDLLEREGILAETSLKWYGEDITRLPKRGQ